MRCAQRSQQHTVKLSHCVQQPFRGRRCSHRCSHLLGARGWSYSTCQRRHGRDLMSDRTSGAWKACSLDGMTAWKCPEPTNWAVVVKDGARARDVNFGRKHFIFTVRASWPVRKISPRRPISSARGVSRLSPHLESTLSTLPMSDQTLGRSRGGADKYCVTDPGPPVSRCEHRCEHLRHGPNLMSDRT